jgi:hypothetical protein
MRAWILLATLPLACTAVDGKLTSTGQPLGDHDFIPDDCKPGATAQYALSVTLVRSDSDMHVHVAEDDINGMVVVVDAPEVGDPGIKLYADQCRTFDVEVGTDDCGGYEGHVEIDCDLPPPAARTAGSAPPGTLRGKVTFEHCY